MYSSFFLAVCLNLVTVLAPISCSSIFLSGPDQEVPLYRFAQYSCLIQNGTGFLLWTISGFTSQDVTLPIFRNVQSVGETSFEQGFGATLTGTTNGIESVLSFNVTMDHNTTSIICGDTGNIIDQINVNIQGPPGESTSFRIEDVNNTTVRLIWSRPNDESIIKEYQVSVNGVVETTSVTELLVSLAGETNIIITAIDNAGRSGMPFSDFYNYSIPTEVNTKFTVLSNSSNIVVANSINNNVVSGVQASWEEEPSSSIPDPTYYIIYTFNNVTYQFSTIETFAVIPVDSHIVNYTLYDVQIIAGNIVGNTTIFSGHIRVTERDGESTITVIKIPDYIYIIIGIFVVISIVLVVFGIAFLLFKCYQKGSVKPERA